MLGYRTVIGALAALGFVALGFAGTATAQTYYVQNYQPASVQPEPLYPYVTQPQVIYAVPQYAPPPYPYVRSVPPAQVSRSRSKTDPALIEELRKRRHTIREAKKTDERAELTPEQKSEHKRIDKTIVVREKPVVRKTYRVVDDPPVVVQREFDESQLPPAPPRAQQDTGRVIHAEAEVTILGPDRMSIRLYRKRDGSDANAKVTGQKKD